MTVSKPIVACLVVVVFCCVPSSHAQQVKVGPPQLDIAECSTFEQQWNDRGSGAKIDGAFWRPVKSGYYPVGDLVVDNYDDPNSHQGVLVVRDGVAGATRKPVDYKRVWTESGSGADQKGSIWQPIPPQGYVAMGCVAQSGHNKPNTDAIRCIRRDLVTPGDIGALVWSDKGSGANEDVSTYAVYSLNEHTSPSPFAFITSGNDSPPRRHPCAYSFSTKAKSKEITIGRGVLVLKIFEVTPMDNLENRQMFFELHQVAKDFTISSAENYKKSSPNEQKGFERFKGTIAEALRSNTNPLQVSSKLVPDDSVEEIDRNRKTWRANVLIDGFLEADGDRRVLKIRKGGVSVFSVAEPVAFQSFGYGSLMISVNQQRRD